MEDKNILKGRYIEYEQYIDNLKVYRDNKNSLDTARDEGNAEGKKMKTIEIAKKLKSLGMSFVQISEITNLPIEEIKKIIN